MTRRRIQPKPTLELETVSQRLPAHLVRAVDQYAKFLGRTDRTYVIVQAIEIALAQDTDLQNLPSRRPPGPSRPRRRVTAVPTCLHYAVTPNGARLAPPAHRRNTAVLTPTFSATHRGALSL